MNVLFTANQIMVSAALEASDCSPLEKDLVRAFQDAYRAIGERDEIRFLQASERMQELTDTIMAEQESSPVAMVSNWLVGQVAVADELINRALEGGVPKLQV